MKGMDKAFDYISRKAEREMDEGDFVGVDGLVYCGRCGTARQVRLEVFGRESVVWCICKCEQAANEAEKAAREAREKAERVRRMKLDGFPESTYAEWTFANDDGKDPRTTGIARRYAENFASMAEKGNGLVLWGGMGTGKTYASACIANAVMEQGYSVLMTNMSRIYNTVNATWEKRQADIDRLMAYDLLIVDDLGVERGSEHVTETVYAVVDGRYKAGKPMVVSTNLGIEELKATADLGRARVYQRILERCYPVEVKGPNRRIKGMTDNFFEMKALLEE